MEQLSREENIILAKFRRAKKYAQDNKQAELRIRVLPTGRMLIAEDTFREVIELEHQGFKR